MGSSNTERGRRAINIDDGEKDRRGKGTPIPDAIADSGDGLTQAEIDRLVSGGEISDN
ncbi:MAG: hypothetical protein P8L79_07460 [Rhodospirillaceae bacterium]|nr:hypothetical protein [Rhodospirillaceae bacterium]